MKFSKILSIAFTFTLAYAQVPDYSAENGIVSDLESNQVPDVYNVSPQNTADNVGAEYSDDYGDDAGINALDANNENSDNEAEIANLANSEPATPFTPEVPQVNTPETTPETTSPEATVPEVTVPEVTTPTTPEETSPSSTQVSTESTPAENPLAGPSGGILQNEIPLLEPIFSGASGEAAPIAAQEEKEAKETEKETPKETPIAALDDNSKAGNTIDPAKIASGLVGVAAVSSAGIFFMVKRAKRRGLESVRSQISMA